MMARPRAIASLPRPCGQHQHQHQPGIPLPATPLWTAPAGDSKMHIGFESPTLAMRCRTRLRSSAAITSLLGVMASAISCVTGTRA